MNKQQVKEMFEFITETFYDMYTYRSTKLTSIALPKIVFEEVLHDDKFELQSFVEYIPHYKDEVFHDNGKPFRHPILRSQTDDKEKEDIFYTQFLDHFLRIMVFGKSWLNMSDIIQGKGDMKWQSSVVKTLHDPPKPPVNFISIMEDRGAFGPRKQNKNDTTKT